MNYANSTAEAQVGLHEVQPIKGDRLIAKSSKGHFIGWLTVGEGADRSIIQCESYLELRWCLCLLSMMETASIADQVAFPWEAVSPDGEVKQRTHFFDFVVTQKDGTRVAYAVKPAAGYRGTFKQELPHISAQAIASGFADDVRLLTDEDLDPVMLFNAELLYSVRHADETADEKAQILVTAMSGIATLGELTEKLGLGAMGRRALLRLIGSHHLRLVEPERIGSNTKLYKAENP